MGVGLNVIENVEIRPRAGASIQSPVDCIADARDASSLEAGMIRRVREVEDLLEKFDDGHHGETIHPQKTSQLDAGDVALLAATSHVRGDVSEEGAGMRRHSTTSSSLGNPGPLEGFR